MPLLLVSRSGEESQDSGGGVFRSWDMQSNGFDLKRTPPVHEAPHDKGSSMCIHVPQVLPTCTASCGTCTASLRGIDHRTPFGLLLRRNHTPETVLRCFKMRLFIGSKLGWILEVTKHPGTQKARWCRNNSFGTCGRYSISS